MSYAILAEFRLKSECVNDFMARMSEHRAHSLTEPGCQIFEVTQDAADPTHVILYERYTDEPAYATHRATPHYERFRNWAPPLIVRSGNEIFLRRTVLHAQV